MRYNNNFNPTLRRPSNSIIDSLLTEQSALQKRLREITEELRHKKIQCDHTFELTRYEPNPHNKHHSYCYYKCSKCFDTETRQLYLPQHHHL